MKRFSIIFIASTVLLTYGCSKDSFVEKKGEPFLNFSIDRSGTLEVKSEVSSDYSYIEPEMYFVSADESVVMPVTMTVSPTRMSDGTSTKATQATSVTSFYAKGFDGTTQWFPKSGGAQEVTPGTQYNYFWTKDKTLTFYGYVNLPDTGASVSVESTGISLSYSVPTDPASQNDILLGRYSGDGKVNGVDSGTAKMEFFHPLTTVKFIAGTLQDIQNVKNIKIEGIVNSGSAVFNMDNAVAEDGSAAFVWDTSSASEQTITQTIDSVPPEDSPIGATLILIPQNFATNNVHISIDAVIYDEGELKNVNLKADLTEGSWEAGKTYTYTVNFYMAPPPNEIWYWTTEGQILNKSPRSDTNDINVFGANITSSTYAYGKGIIRFDGPISKIGDFAFGSTDLTVSKEFGGYYVTNIWFPEGVTTLGDTILRSDLGNAQTGSLQEIVIPKSVTSISWGRGTFNGTGCPVTVGYDNAITYSIYTHPGPYGNQNYSFYLTLGNGQTGEVHSCCFVKGTLITMADGSKKKVEELEYGDVLKVWNFDEGHEDVADILWITERGLTAPYYFKCTFSDGTVLNVVGEDGGGTHRMFDKTKGSFEHPHTIPVDDEIYTEHGLVKLVSYERIDEEVEYFNLITTKHINCYANDVLTSARYNNRWPIDEDMKFVKDGRKIRPYREFRKAGISREWYVGMRLGEQQDSIARVKAYIDRCEMFTRPKPEQPVFTSIWEKIVTWWKSIFG